MNNKLKKINLFDRVNAFVLSLVTPEMKDLRHARKVNNYNDQKPTFEKPFQMGFEYVLIDGIKVRMARSILDSNKPTIVLLSPFPHSIMAYAPIWELLKVDFNLYAYDLPGFGRSEAGSDFMSFKF